MTHALLRRGKLVTGEATVGEGRESSTSSAQFCCDSKTALKIVLKFLQLESTLGLSEEGGWGPLPEMKVLPASLDTQ